MMVERLLLNEFKHYHIFTECNEDNIIQDAQKYTKCKPSHISERVFMNPCNDITIAPFDDILARS